MPDYQKMYTTLFNKVSDIIVDLQQVQQLTEELYINSTPDLEIVEFPKDIEKNRPQN